METKDIKTIEYFDPVVEHNLFKLNNNSYYGLEKYYYHPKLTIDNLKNTDDIKFICKKTNKLYQGGKIFNILGSKIYYIIENKGYSIIKFKNHYIFRKGFPLYDNPNKKNTYNKKNNKNNKFKYLLNGLNDNTIRVKKI